MILLLHIILASASVLFTTYALFFPSEKKVSASYVLFSLTLISGIALLILQPNHIAKTCVTGLVYSAVVLTEIFSAKYRLRSQIIKS